MLMAKETDVIQLRSWEGKIPWIIRVGPKCNHRGPQQREAGRSMEGIGDVRTDGSSWTNVGKEP